MSLSDRILGALAGVGGAILVIVGLCFAALMVILLWSVHPSVGIMAIIGIAYGAYLGWRDA